jgi:hypothetical protein
VVPGDVERICVPLLMRVGAGKESVQAVIGALGKGLHAMLRPVDGLSFAADVPVGLRDAQEAVGQREVAPQNGDELIDVAASTSEVLHDGCDPEAPPVVALLARPEPRNQVPLGARELLVTR